jgi:hypothetical protein
MGIPARYPLTMTVPVTGIDSVDFNWQSCTNEYHKLEEKTKEIGDTVYSPMFLRFHMVS